MTGLDLDRIDQLVRRWPGSTHWSDCHYAHVMCAILALIREVEGLRERLADVGRLLQEEHDVHHEGCCVDPGDLCHVGQVLGGCDLAPEEATDGR